MDNSFGDKLLETIEQKKIKPTRKCFVFARRSFWWLLAFILFVGAVISFSLFSFLFVNTDWALIKEIQNTAFLPSFFQALPYLWIIFFAVFAFALFFVIRHTQFGHRYKKTLLLGGGAVSIVIFGFSCFAFGAAEILEMSLEKSFPMYKKMDQMRHVHLHRPEIGHLSGVIIGQGEGKIFLLQDLKNKEWTVFYQNAEVPQRMPLASGVRVKMQGKQVGENSFDAKKIHPWFMKKRLFIRINR